MTSRTQTGSGAGTRVLAGYTGMALSAVLADAGLASLGGTAKIVAVIVGLDAFIVSVAMSAGGNGVAAALCLLAIMFIALFPPETEGHSVEETTRLFEQPGGQAIPASVQDT